MGAWLLQYFNCIQKDCYYIFHRYKSQTLFRSDPYYSFCYIKVTSFISLSPNYTRCKVYTSKRSKISPLVCFFLPNSWLNRLGWAGKYHKVNVFAICKTFQVKHILPTDVSTKPDSSFWKTIAHHTVPMFKPPLLWRTIQLFFLLALCCSVLVFFNL